MIFVLFLTIQQQMFYLYTNAIHFVANENSLEPETKNKQECFCFHYTCSMVEVDTTALLHLQIHHNKFSRLQQYVFPPTPTITPHDKIAAQHNTNTNNLYKYKYLIPEIRIIFLKENTN